ncbi:tRNA (guanosine(46)-N7)-methyltransferase TrmB [Sphingobacterium sp. lm-10]|uniref:tRNA (guanosine(46)-N7)-methyltransferase TrmB n=1 Tax=Sphingobacterium sp. lm-10 TaxID=2944904 RepID=UPI00202148F1|nr:tRNA (guanosine(46)-N7)-methyltransferase TrmB [Sphingobacterium sp. lm-10]MCL7988536.1 tRNA (guanosine(46)-N7)-methyltransferase TrmB [Sphingobacterium sp. lm-10]
MGKDKLRRFAEVATFKNVVQLDAGKDFKGQWAKDFFGNNQPIVLELACGKGEYTVNLAKLFPDINFIGVDFKGNRIWRGAKTALEEGIHNVGFLRIQIESILEHFAENEVAEIWITFPDPQPQDSREKKRLTSPRFMQKYKIILQDDGIMHLKTDNDEFYAYTLEQIAAGKMPITKETTDLYASALVDDVLSIKTYYEKKYLADDKNINYVQWQFPQQG